MRSTYHIGGYLRPEEKDAFYAYAAEFHLRPASLANLLVARELRCKRLPSLVPLYGDRHGSGRKRITARQQNSELREAFASHVAQCGIAPDPAATILFRAELDEKWLRKAVAAAAVDSP